MYEDSSKIKVDAETLFELMQLKGKVDAFKDFVNQSDFSISREDCAAILGFNLINKSDAFTMTVTLDDED